jgi:protease YdgD
MKLAALWWKLPTLIVCALLLSFPGYCQAGELEPTEWPLSSVGRVNVIAGTGRRSQCTGTLVGPRHVLTAGHCLFDKVRQVWVHPTSVHFVAGYERGDYKAHAQAISYERGLGFALTNPPQPQSAAQDWALIELAGPIDSKPIQVQPDGEAVPRTGRIIHAGYRGDRSHVLTIQRDCSVSSVSHPAPLLFNSCRSVQGESGSALLSFEGGVPRIIGILVGRATQDGAAFSIAVPSRTFRAAVA